ncbi:MAG: FmdB family zinc ribbon protein [Spirochaetaceae bacterium]
MPTYDYECTECGYEFEYFQAMSDEPLSTCSSCGGRLRRLIGGGTGIIFKGSGFYVTDNGKNNKVGQGNGNGKDNDNKNGGSSSAESSSKGDSSSTGEGPSTGEGSQKKRGKQPVSSEKKSVGSSAAK